MTVVSRVPDIGSAGRRVLAPLGAAAAAGLATLALQLRDPHVHGSWGLCPFRAITGWDCPGCGGLRAVNDLGHGRLADAAHSNLLLVATLPVVVALWAVWLRRGWTGAPVRLPARVVRPLAVGCGVLVLVFAVFRNTPWGGDWSVA
jgi:hypothetical protein